MSTDDLYQQALVRLAREAAGAGRLPAPGVEAILPNVDEHRPVHSLDSLAALAEALSAPYRRRRTAPAARPRGP